MPGAIPKGLLPINPIMIEPKAAVKAVPKYTYDPSIPVLLKMEELTNKIYDIEKKVIRPPKISFLMVVLLLFNLNILSNINSPLK